MRRLLSLRPRVAVAYVENAWFGLPACAHCASPNRTAKLYSSTALAELQQQAFGAWSQHEPLLRHYGVPAVNMPLACSALATDAVEGQGDGEGDGSVENGGSSARALGRRKSAAAAAALSRERMVYDKLHLSLEGHVAAALFVAAMLVFERERLEATLRPPQAVLPSDSTAEQHDGARPPPSALRPPPSALRPPPSAQPQAHSAAQLTWPGPGIGARHNARLHGEGRRLPRHDQCRRRVAQAATA